MDGDDAAADDADEAQDADSDAASEIVKMTLR